MHNNIDDLRYIRSTMERSSKFLSLSGLSGVFAGIFALLGASLAYFVLYDDLYITADIRVDIVLVAILVILGASASGLHFSIKKANRTNSKFWMPATIQIIKDAGVPMFAGGMFCLILMYHQSYFLIASTMLIFYGIALINAGARTYRDVKILGACQVFLGLFAGFFSTYGLLFWAVGFGVLHIIYGMVMYKKYDVESEKNI